ncbi:MAG: hypothetical protein HYW38_01160 [Candidatus Colwellbacteria bacterium]|nr:hypothetical protein [Candidatus Colwellbacteria bacterium]
MVLKEQAKVISIGDLFSESWKLYRERIGVLTKIMLLPVAFLLVGDLWELLNTVTWFGGLSGFIGTVVSFFAALALIFALQEKVQFGESYRLAFRKIWSYGWLTVLSGFATLGGFVMLVIPGIIFVIWFVFAIYVFAIEGEKGMNALLRSREYVRGYWWQVFGRQIVLVLVALAAVLGLGFIGAILAADEGAAFVINLFTLILAPFITVYLYMLYQNVKSLKPEVAGQPATGPRGFFYFSAVLGVVGLIALLVLIVVLAAAYLYQLPQ